MTFEFQAAWQKMNAGGVLLSDDIHMSKAFGQFITGKQVGLSLAGNRFGVAFKKLMRVRSVLAINGKSVEGIVTYPTENGHSIGIIQRKKNSAGVQPPLNGFFCLQKY